MEPLQGWGPPPWSLAPKAAALRLALLCLCLGALLSEDRAPCRKGEYPVGAKCCPRCSPGHRVKEACGETTGTVCAPCSPGTYTAHRNSLEACLSCHLCDPDTGLVTRRKCSSTGNTVCGCDRGYFCVLVDGDHCAECRPHSDCRPGQRVQVTGTERQDTLCEVCPPGTFSTGGTQAVCEPWSKCSGPLEREAQPGTNSTDVTCSSSVTVAILCGCTVILVIFITVSLRYLIIRIRRSCGETSQKTHNVQVSVALPDISPGAVEETALVIPARDPPADECFRVQTSEHPRGLLTAPGPRGLNVGPGEPLGPAPGWRSLPRAEEMTLYCSGGLGAHTWDLLKLLWCLSPPPTPY